MFDIVGDNEYLCVYISLRECLFVLIIVALDVHLIQDLTRPELYIFFFL